MNKISLRKLAQITIKDGKADEKIARFVLEYLSKNETKTYLNFLKSHLSKDRVYVKISDDITNSIKNDILKIFKGKNVIFEKDNSLGAGIVIKDSDNVINLSLKGYLDKTIQNLENVI